MHGEELGRPLLPPWYCEVLTPASVYSLKTPHTFFIQPPS
jgi:hypothetical protein